jgi:hypothetical protein
VIVKSKKITFQWDLLHEENLFNLTTYFTTTCVIIIISFYLCMWLEWNRVHYYWGYLLAYSTSPVWCGDCAAMNGMNEWQEKLKNSKKICPGAALFDTDLTWRDLGSNLGRRGGNLVTNRLSYRLNCDRPSEFPCEDRKIVVCVLFLGCFIHILNYMCTI